MRACCAIVGNDEILNLLLLNHDSESSIVEPSRSYSCHPSIYTSLRISFRFGISSEDKFATCSRRVLTRFEGLDSTSTSTPSSLVPGSNQAVAVTGGSGRKKRSAGAINSWVLFRDARLKSRPARIGETREQRRKRVIEEASIDFKKPEFRDEKKMLSLVAKERNAVVRLGKKHPAIAAKSESQSHRKNPSDVDMVVASMSSQSSISKLLRQSKGAVPTQGAVVPAATTGSGALAPWTEQHGPWGVSSTAWPISARLVELATTGQRSKGTIKSESEKWRNHTGKPVAASEDVAQDVELSSGIREEVSFCMKLGGCFQASTLEQQECILRNLAFFRNIVRHLKKGNKNQSKPVAPLLVMAAPKELGLQPQVFLLCKPNFRPFDVLFWSCDLQPCPGSPESATAACPESFDAHLKLGHHWGQATRATL